MIVVVWLVGLFVAMPLLILGPLATLYGVTEVDGGLVVAGVLATTVSLALVNWLRRYT